MLEYLGWRQGSRTDGCSEFKCIASVVRLVHTNGDFGVEEYIETFFSCDPL
jgi:hypothetical protein